MNEQVNLDSIAELLHHRGLDAPAIFMLEMLKPLTFIGLSGMHIASPFLKMVLGISKTESLIELLSSRESLENLISRIESLNKTKQSN